MAQRASTRMIPPEDFWQTIEPPGDFQPPYIDWYPARLPDGHILRLPLRPLPGGGHALASLIINQASFAVVEALAGALADALRPAAPEIVIGLPTLGLTLAAAVARKLGHARYIPLGTSRKFWYQDKLSVPLASVTTPGPGKRLYLDPRMLPLLAERRAVLIDDVASSGASMQAGLNLLATAGVTPVALGVAMLQSDRWRVLLADWASRIFTVLRTPLLTPTPNGGWTV